MGRRPKIKNFSKIYLDCERERAHLKYLFQMFAKESVINQFKKAYLKYDEEGLKESILSLYSLMKASKYGKRTIESFALLEDIVINNHLTD